MPMIELRTLGAMDLRAADGRELHALLAQPKRIALLAYLCIAQPRGFHRRDTLLGLFWPNADQEHARTSLRKSLHILRRAVGDDVVLSRGDDEVRVDLERVTCDVIAFETDVRSNRLEEALERYRGDLLPGFFIDEAPEFEQWLHSERRGLRASAARAALDLSNRLEASGDKAAAVNWARRSLELSDGDERALRKLMELEWRDGRAGEAIDAYENFARNLATEYETQPSADVRSLVERIRSGIGLPGRRREETAEETADVSRVRNDAITTAKPRHWLERNKLYAVLTLGLLMIVAAIWGWGRPATAKRVVRYALVVDSSEMIAKGGSWSGRIALSSDGERLAYIGGPRSQLLIRPFNELRATALPATEGAKTPFFSPDGRQVGFLEEHEVRIASINGGPPITVTDTLTGQAGASWGPDNFIYVDGSGATGLLRVEAKPRAIPRWFTVLDTASGEFDHTWPDVLPNGKGVVFTVTFNGRKGPKGTISYAIAVAEIPSGKHRVIVDDAVFARYASSGYLVYVTANKTLMAVPFDQSSMAITGEPSAVVEGMRLGLFGSADLALSATGTLVYATGGGPGNQELVWVSRDGKTQPVDPDWLAEYLGDPVISPDGHWLAVSRLVNETIRGNPWTEPYNVWIKRLDRGAATKFTLEGNDNEYPEWTPDGKSITFSSDAGAAPSDLWTKPVHGSGQAVLQLHEDRSLYGARWSPDGKWLVFRTDLAQRGAGDILAIRPKIDTAPILIAATKFTETDPAISPDGRWLAYSSNESGPYQIYVVPFPSVGTKKLTISTGGGTEPVWSHHSGELFYRDGAGDLVAVEVRTKPTFSMGRSTPLFPAAGFAYYTDGVQYAVAPDDRRFLMIRPAETGTPDKVVVVENWYEELKAKSRK